MISLICLSLYAIVNISVVHGRSVSLGLYPFLGNELRNTELPLPGAKRCFDELGCFETGGAFYHPLRRPVNLLPAARESIDTKYRLFTRANGRNNTEILSWRSSVDDWRKSVFNAKLKTKIIIHGWLDTHYLVRWMSNMKDAFLKRDDYNVIIVDWQGGNSLPYTQAVANTRLVGAEVALMIEKLGKTFGVTPETFHVLGHSLGGQIAGYVGKRTKNLGRITAMDPAEPYFQGMPPEVRTMPTDALFVEGIHTDSASFFTHLGLGMKDPVGHVDFYPNGGEFMPGCNIKGRVKKFIAEGIVDGVRDIVACNHIKSLEYVIDAINKNNTCRHVGHQCQSYELFKEGKCADCGENGQKCAAMNIEDQSSFERFKQNNVSVKMYLNTAPQAPFCLFHYQVQLKMLPPSADRKAVSGSYYITLHGSKGSTEIQLNSKRVSVHPGSQHTFLATTQVDVGELKSYGFRWTTSPFSNFFGAPNMYLDFVQVAPMNPLDTKYDRVKHRFCVDSPQKGIAPKINVSLKTCP